LVLSRVRLIRVRLVLVNLNPINNTYIDLVCLSFMVLPLPPSITNTSNKAWGDAFRWLRMRLVYGWRKSRDASHPVNLSRVLTILWHVRGLYRCLGHARGLCLSPCVTTPGGLLPSHHRRWSIVFRVLFQQTNKQKNKKLSLPVHRFS